MTRQLQITKTWAKRKALIIVVFVVAVLLISFSLYYFASQNHGLEAKIAEYPHIFSIIENNGNGWAWSGSGLGVVLMGIVLVLLLREVRIRKKVLEELKIQKEHYRITISSMAEGLITTGNKGEIVYMNTAAEKLTGWSLSEAAGLPLDSVYKVANEETGKPFESIVSRILKKGEFVAFENNTILHTKQSVTRIISNSGSPLFDAKGEISGAVLVFNDITEKKNIETELREREKQYRMLIQQLPKAVYTCDANGSIKVYNKAAVDLWGQEPPVESRKWCGAYKIFHTDGTIMQPEETSVFRSIKTRQPLFGEEMIIQRPDESFRHILSYPTPIYDDAGNFSGLVNMVIDVTENKEKEILIRQSEEKYKTLIEQASDAIFVFEKNGQVVEVNDQASEMFGFSYEEWIKFNLTSIIADGMTAESGNLQKQLEDGINIRIEKDVLHRQGHSIPVELTAKMLSDGRFMAIFRDISDRRNAEKEIQDYQFALDTSCIIDIADSNGIIRYVNENFTRIAKYSKEELIGQDHKIFNSGHHNKAFYRNLWTTIGKGKVWRGELKNRAKDGSYFWVDTTIVPFLDTEGKPFQFITIRTDITKLRVSENFISGVLDSLSSHIAVVNAKGYIVSTNAPWRNFAVKAGSEKAVILSEGVNYFDICRSAADAGDEIGAKSLEGIKQVLEGLRKEFYLEYPCHTPTEEKWFYMRVMKFESSETLLVIEHHDITERVKSEIVTLKAVERYDILAKATSDTIWDWDLVNNKILYSSGVTKMFGVQLSEIDDIIAWWNSHIHPDDLEMVIQSFTKVINDKQQHIQLEYRFQCADGTYKYIFDRAFVTYNDQNEAMRMIGAMQDVTYAKEEEIRIAKAIIDAQERERRFIGQELHDNVNQILASALLANGMIKSCKNNAEIIDQYTGLTKEYTEKAIDEIRKLSHELAPAQYDDRTIEDVFSELLESINLDHRYSVKFCFDERINNVISDEIKINIYRILQEQVKNIIKYAEATSIEVEVNLTDTALIMRMQDNGKGFEPQKVKSGIGLNNIKKRVDSLSGKFILNAEPGQGCEINIEIPVIA
jgi:two-component system sensor histidine kinase UhpB